MGMGPKGDRQIESALDMEGKQGDAGDDDDDDDGEGEGQGEGEGAGSGDGSPSLHLPAGVLEIRSGVGGDDGVEEEEEKGSKERGSSSSMKASMRKGKGSGEEGVYSPY